MAEDGVDARRGHVDRDGTSYQTASYIAEITTELAELARGAKLDLVAYLLDIAQLEAATTVRREATPRRGPA